MDKYHAFELGLAMGKGMLLNNQIDRESLATDSEVWIAVKEGKIMRFNNNLAYDRWITIHPHGDDNRHIEIDDKTGEILKGLSPNLQGTHIYDLKENLKRLKEGKKPYTVSDYPNGKNQPKQVEQPENKSPKFKNYYENPVYKYNEEALSKLVRKDLSDTIQNILKENEFADLKEFSKYLKENNPAAYKALQKIKEQQWFKSQSISNKFFGKDGIDHVSNKYFRINHNPDENTVLLEVDRNRIRTVGQDKKYVYILDKNKAIYLKNTLPVLSWNDDTKEQKIHLIAKFNKDDKIYSFKNDFDAASDLKPINGFSGLVDLAKERDNTLKYYRNVPEKEIGDYYLEINSQVDDYLKKIRPKSERVTVTDAELNSYLGAWNRKIYRYGDGTKAIFSKGKKIVLTDEQFESLVPLEER
ncbi:hypothetical protein [Ruminobacter sp.]|uniref:hypothetical protein n=1 Tax=Ruminobacter sp. TaxID=2774296 RepID=UPI00386372F1